MRYVLHIGLPKCGSTSLQAFLSSNAGLLLEHAVLYPCGPDYPHRRQHSWIVQSLDEAHGPLTALLNACRAHDTAVLSGEYLTNLTRVQVQRFRDRIADEGGGDRFSVILYVRNLADLVLALCAEWVKLNGRAYHDTIAHPQWSITSVIETWEGVFGADAVDVRLLEAAAPSLEADFMAAAGLPWRESYVRPPRLNQTADPLSSQLLRLLEIEYGRDPAHRALLQTVRKLPRLENHYLAQIGQVIGRIDLSHPKLARHAERLTALNWRDESDAPALADYLNNLIAGLLQVRNHALAAAARGAAER